MKQPGFNGKDSAVFFYLKTMETNPSRQRSHIPPNGKIICDSIFISFYFSATKVYIKVSIGVWSNYSDLPWPGPPKGSWGYSIWPDSWVWPPPRIPVRLGWDPLLNMGLIIKGTQQAPSFFRLRNPPWGQRLQFGFQALSQTRRRWPYRSTPRCISWRSGCFFAQAVHLWLEQKHGEKVHGTNTWVVSMYWNQLVSKFK